MKNRKSKYHDADSVFIYDKTSEYTIDDFNTLSITKLHDIVRHHMYYGIRNVKMLSRNELIQKIYDKHHENRNKAVNYTNDEQKEEIVHEERKEEESTLVSFSDMMKKKFLDITHFIVNGEVWFYGNQVAQLFEYKDYKNTIIRLKCIKMVYENLYSSTLAICQCRGNGVIHPETVFIDKRGVFQLIMNSEMPLAVQFQEVLIYDIIPSILQNGYYVSPSATNEQLQRLQEQVENEQNERLRIESESYERIKRIEHEKEQLQLQLQQRPSLDIVFTNRLINEQREEEYMYIITSIQYAQQKVFKVGRTNDTLKRVASLNTSNITNDQQLYVCDMFKCFNASKVEDTLFVILKNYRYHTKREFFVFNYTSLQKVVKLCCEHNTIEYETFDDIIKSEQIRIIEPYIPPPLTIPTTKKISKNTNNQITQYFDKN